MELNEFVSQSLTQIFEGVHQAQELTKAFGGSISPKVINTQAANSNVIGNTHKQTVVSIDFDVSVSIVDSTNVKSGFGVFIAAFTGGLQTGETTKNEYLSRLRFSVPAILPFIPDVAITEQ